VLSHLAGQHPLWESHRRDRRSPSVHLAGTRNDAYVLLSGAFLLWAVGHLGIVWTPASVVYLLLAILGGACLQAAALIALGSLIFLAGRLNFIFNLYYSSFR